jgi:UTP--glucose-1-phosphate uridylyltransferase
VLRSDAYALSDAWTVEPAVTPVPLVKLDDAFYKLVDRFERLVPRVPSLIACTSLTVKGPVRFGPGVTIEGDVTLEAPAGATAAEPATVSQAAFASGKHSVRAGGVVDVSASGGAAAQPALA